MSPDQLVDFLSKAVTSEVLYLTLMVILFFLCRKDRNDLEAKYESLIVRYETLLSNTIKALTELDEHNES